MTRQSLLQFSARWWFICIAVLLVGAGCGDDTLTPNRPPQPLRALGDEGFSGVTLGIVNSSEPYGSTTLPSFSERRYVEFTISGLITAVPNPEAPNLPSGSTIGPRGIYFTNGNAGIAARIAYSYGWNELTPQPSPAWGTDQPTTGTLRVVVQGSGTASRSASPVWPRCWNHTRSALVPCFSYFGEWSISAKVIDVQARWKHVSWTWAMSPQLNYFEWAIEDSVPANVLSQTLQWRFEPADGTAAVDISSFCDMYGRGCNYYVTRSGTIIADVRVNGKDKSLSQYVHIGPPSVALAATPNPVPRGDTVRFTATPIPATVSVGAVRWFWTPSGIASLRTNRLAVEQAAASPMAARMAVLQQGEYEVCAGSGLSCRFAPGTEGTMRVEAVLANALTTSELSVGLTEPRSLIDVSCGDSVPMRGTVSCVATSARPGGNLQVTGWKFVSSEPDAPYELIRDDGVITSTSWSGTAVLGGEVSVEGTVDGQTANGSARYRITANPLSDALALSVHPRNPSALIDPPAAESLLGNADFIASLDTSALGTVGSGPNTYVSFFRRIPWKVDALIDVNMAALAAGSIFTSMQPRQRDSSKNPPGCSKADVPAAEPGIRRHEGFARSDVNSHVDTWSAAFERDARVWGSRLTSYHNMNIDSLRVALHAAAIATSNTITHNYATNPWQFPCVFNFQASITYP